MTGQVEYGDSSRHDHTFPRHWGPVEGETNEERSVWIMRNIATDQVLERRGLDPVEVRSGKRNMSAHAALARALRLRAVI